MKIGSDMSDYPKFSFDKSRTPPLSLEIAERVKEYERRMLRYVALPDPYAPSMSFEKFKELFGKRRKVDVHPENVYPLNPNNRMYKEFKEWLNENGAE